MRSLRLFTSTSRVTIFCSGTVAPGTEAKAAVMTDVLIDQIDRFEKGF